MAILDTLDLGRIFKAAEQAGFLYSDLYAEKLDTATLSLHEKIDETRLARTTGVSLRCFDGEKMRFYSSTQLCTESILAFLSGQRSERLIPTAGDFPLKGESFTESNELTHVIQNTRKTLLEQERVEQVQLDFESRKKSFEIATCSGVRGEGQEETASLKSEWSVQKKNGLQTFRSQECGRNVQKLIEQSKKENVLGQRISHSISLQERWPAPRGEMPILWSPRAYAKLCLHFLRAFEGDLVLANHSFLTKMTPPLPLPFSIEDAFEEGPAQIDYEGSPRRSLTLFAEGRPRGLACNNFVAEQLNVSSTGHCRRENFHDLPTVGFWNPRIAGKHCDSDLLPNLQWGLSIRDLEVARFDPQTAEIEINLTTGFLIHHGAEGELIEPIFLKTNLISLLQASHVFSPQTTAVGLSLIKQSQRLITEIQSPQVLSSPFYLPGSVPLNHYW